MNTQQLAILFVVFVIGVSAGIGARDYQAHNKYVSNLEDERDCILIGGEFTIDIDGNNLCNIDIVPMGGN